MSERLTRHKITPPPQSELPILLRVGCMFEETQEGMIVTYPEGAVRETIDEGKGRYAVFFPFQYETRQIIEHYNRSIDQYMIFLKPARFHS